MDIIRNIKDERTGQSGDVIFFKRSIPGKAEPIEESLPGEREDAAPGKRLLCGICGHHITSRDRAVEESGSHTHVFTNPAGVTFHIGCFSSAPGCHSEGDPTEEYTWFPGCAWSFALCGGCMAHLGWLYESGSRRFYGLILAGLVEENLQ